MARTCKISYPKKRQLEGREEILKQTASIISIPLYYLCICTLHL